MQEKRYTISSSVQSLGDLVQCPHMTKRRSPEAWLQRNLVQTTVTDEFKARLEALAVERKSSISRLVRNILRAELERTGGELYK